jgi:thioredoxin-related protein
MIKRSLQQFLLLIAVLPGLSLAMEARDPATHFFNENFGNFQEELATAKSQGKKGVMIFFEMDECPFCHRMKTTVLNRADVQDYFRQNFLLFSVDTEGDIEVTDFAGNPTTQKELAFKQFRVRATPVIAFFDLEGNMVQKYTGASADAEEFLLLGRFVTGGHYKDGNFSRYKRDQRPQTGAQ